MGAACWGSLQPMQAAYGDSLCWQPVGQLMGAAYGGSLGARFLMKRFAGRRGPPPPHPPPLEQMLVDFGDCFNQME